MMQIRKWHVFLFFSLFLASGCSRHSSQAQGYIEGDYTYIATSVSGALQQLFVDRGTWVKQGQLLFMLEPQPESDLYHAAIESLNQSKAARNAITATLNFSRLTYERYKVLVPKNAIEVSALDNARSTYENTLAQLARANATIAADEAALAKAKWTLEQKNVYAPVDAFVFDRYYRVGEYTQAGQPIISLLTAENIKAIFFVNEESVGKIKLGDTVTVQCSGCKQMYKGKITFISPTAEYTPPVIYSTETTDKLIFRIEAHFNKKEAYHLHPGQSVLVTYL